MEQCTKRKSQICQQWTILIIIINKNTNRMKPWNHQFLSLDDSRLNNGNGNVIISINKQALTSIDAEKERKEIQPIWFIMILPLTTINNLKQSVLFYYHYYRRYAIRHIMKFFAIFFWLSMATTATMGWVSKPKRRSRSMLNLANNQTA